MPPWIELRDVEVMLGGERVLSSVNLRLEGPGLVQVLGPNGAGKTTLLRVMLGLLRPSKGRVLVNGDDVTGRPGLAGKRMGYVPQLEQRPSHYPVTAWEAVLYECLVRCRGWPRIGAGSAASRAEAALEAVGLPRTAWGKRLWELSGGQLQRTMIARALVHNPEALLMDEPLSAVDPAGKAEISELIAGLAEAKLVVVTSHDPMLLIEHTRLIVLVNRGVVAAGPPEEVMRPEILERVYGPSVIYVEKHYHIADEHYTPRR